MNARPTVFVVDDDASMRKSLRWLVESVRLPVETYESAQAFVEQYDPARPGCLVLDVRLPDTSGLDLQQQLIARGVQLPIVFVTAYGDVPSAVQAMKTGAVDFLEKPFSGPVLLDRIQAGLKWDAEWRTQQAQQAELATRLAQLTPRQRRVMELVVAGKPTKAIAAQLGLSIKTVEIHRAAVMKKLQVDNIAELVSLAIAAGVVPATRLSGA